MSGFTAAWLALREPADAAARSSALERDLVSHLGDRSTRRVLDLGCGTGANLRHLAPRLGGRQRWLLVDDDPALLAEAPRRTARWAGSRGMTARVDGPALALAAPGLRCSAETLRHDLTALDGLPLDGFDLVTASALLDLVSAAWLAELVERCRRASVPTLLLVLTYDGRARWSPGEPWDDAVRERLDRHQGGDKGFGPALGPAAAAAARDRLVAAGYRTRAERSDWDVGPAAAALQRELLAGWGEAAAAVDPGSKASIEAWSRARASHLGAGRSRVAVGHLDLLAWLPRADHDGG